MADEKQQLMAAGCPANVAGQIVDACKQAAASVQRKVGGAAGVVGFPGQRLIALLKVVSQDWPVIQKFITDVQTAVAGGNWTGILALIQTDGTAVLQAIEDAAAALGIDLNPAPAAA